MTAMRWYQFQDAAVSLNTLGNLKEWSIVQNVFLRAHIKCYS